MNEFLTSSLHHIAELFTNPSILFLLLIIFTGEYLPFTKLLWNKIGLKFKKLGEYFFKLENKIYKEQKTWVDKDDTKIKINNFFIKMLLFTISSIITIFIEVVWELGFRKATKKLEESNFAKWLTNKINELSNSMVLILFTVPFLLMEFIGIFAITAIASGYIRLGIGLYIFKTLFFIPVHFVLEKGKSKLIKINWFKRRYDIIVAILNWFKKSQTYVQLHNFLEKVKSIIRNLRDLIKNRVILIKKAFEHGELISEECDLIREQISKELKEKNKITPGLYKKFFNCIDTHISNLKKD